MWERGTFIEATLFPAHSFLESALWVTSLSTLDGIPTRFYRFLVALYVIETSLISSNLNRYGLQ